MLLLMCYMPETPRFLLSQQRRQEATAAMQFLWGSEQVWEEPPVGAEHQVRGWEPEPGRAGMGEVGSSDIWPFCSRGRPAQPVPKAVHTHTGRGGTSGGVVLCVSKQRPAGAPLPGRALALTLLFQEEKVPAGSQGNPGAELRNWSFKWGVVGQGRRWSLCRLPAVCPSHP